MRITTLALTQFRNYDSRTFQFDQPTTILVGPNAAGKTTVIEALHLLATGDSFRAGRIEEMIRFEQELGRVVGKVAAEEEEIELEVMLTRGEVQGKATRKRLFSINNVRRSKRKFVGNLLTVVFRPEDMRLIEGSPARRRSFLDTPLTMIDREYNRALSTYTQALTKRNRLLTQVREGEMPRSALTFWTMTILKHGQILQQQRRQFLNFFSTVDFPLPFTIEYDWSEISEERLAKYAEREIAAGYTLVGPHKDDLIVKLAVETEELTEQKRDIALYGSRGQQRMGVLWLKTCELMYLEQQTGQRPVLLLDDILSELDVEHRQHVLELLNGNQAIVTSAADSVIEEILAQHPQSAIIEI